MLGQIRTGVELALAGVADRCFQPLSHEHAMRCVEIEASLGWRMGLEPMTSGITIRRSDQLS